MLIEAVLPDGLNADMKYHYPPGYGPMLTPDSADRIRDWWRDGKCLVERGSGGYFDRNDIPRRLGPVKQIRVRNQFGMHLLTLTVG